MAQMTDPYQALVAFQKAMDEGTIGVTPGLLNPDVLVHGDDAGGYKRMTYVQFDGATVVALVAFVAYDYKDDVPVLQIGYAVAEKYRRQGRAKALVMSAIAEMQNGLAGIFEHVYIEAVVSADNAASRRVGVEPT
jgi:RimJ/RimL family protein N-acetyltransferase